LGEIESSWGNISAIADRIASEINQLPEPVIIAGALIAGSNHQFIHF